jgi:ParB family chromosome partitioning protein
VEAFLDLPLSEALETRGHRAEKLIELDDKAAEAVSALKERGLTSPYLKAFVVARLNPLRFRRGAAMDAEEALDAMIMAAERFDAGKIKITDLASTPPGPPEEPG